jgi:hypothetical protein
VCKVGTGVLVLDTLWYLYDKECNTLCFQMCREHPQEHLSSLFGCPAHKKVQKRPESSTYVNGTISKTSKLTTYNFATFDSDYSIQLLTFSTKAKSDKHVCKKLNTYVVQDKFFQDLGSNTYFGFDSNLYLYNVIKAIFNFVIFLATFLNVLVKLFIFLLDPGSGMGKKSDPG